MIIEKIIDWIRNFFSSLNVSAATISTPPSPEASAASKPSPPSGFTSVQWLRYDYLFQRYADTYSIDWTWLKAFALNESRLGLDPRVSSGGVSSDGLSYGLMQLTIPTASDQKGSQATITDLNNAELSIKWAAKYIAWLYDFTDEDLDLAVQAYNCGPGNIKKGVRVPEYLARFKRNLALVEKYQ